MSSQPFTLTQQPQKERQLITRLVIIDKDLFDDILFVDTLKQNFQIPIELQTECEIEPNNKNDGNLQEKETKQAGVLYISNSFQGKLFEKLLSERKPIISDIIVRHCIQNRIALPLPKWPLYNYLLKDFIICFSINDKRKTTTINKYLNLIRFMHGQSRRDMKSGKSFERTHLITSTTESDNYSLAAIYGRPILYKEWIDFVWEHKRDISFNPNHESVLSKFRIKAFADLRIALYNFPPDELQEKTKQIIEFGGHSVPLQEPNTTHLVVKNSNDSQYLSLLDHYECQPKFVVSEKWLDSSIVAEARGQESDFLIHIPTDNKNETIDSTPTKDELSTLNSILLSPNYDRSFDDSYTVEKNDLKKQAITQELFQTELNYVTILKDIIKIFRDPLKNHGMPGQFPNEIELKTIFGGLPPIIEVHEKILAELEPVVKNWKAENEVGKIFQTHSQELLTVYPQYVNFYEKTKETIEQCINKYPTFNSFLKAGQQSKECRKQTFQELLINPIQRLPRIELYLRTLLERTDKLHPDYKLLSQALNTIVSVNKEINFKKKKTEGQMELFELLNDIEDCPATLVSANRHFLSKCDVKLLIQNTEAENNIQKLENYCFTLLLFTDWILVCKQRTVKRTNSLKDRTPNIPISASKKSKKTYKLIEKIELIHLKCIYDTFDEIVTFPECSDSFALVIDSESRLLQRYYQIFPFIVKDNEMGKDKFLQDIVDACKEVKSSPLDAEFLKKASLKTLDFATARNIARTLNKSKYAFLRTKERLNRTFSMRRHTSNLLSTSLENISAAIPITSSPASRLSRVFTNFNFFTPRENELYKNSDQINSFNDITELDHSDDVNSDNFSLPATPAPRKRMYQAEAD